MLFVSGTVAGACLLALAAFSVSYSSTTEFCQSCHEMRVVGEQGWMKSKHYQNQAGVVAGCTDCHVPPELFPKLWTKTRDGVKDIVVHLFGESDPQHMDWTALGASARSHIYDSACQRCHQNLLPNGASIKMINAHLEYRRLNGAKKCLECHKEEIHPEFKRHLFGESMVAETEDPLHE